MFLPIATTCCIVPLFDSKFMAFCCCIHLLARAGLDLYIAHVEKVSRLMLDLSLSRGTRISLHELLKSIKSTGRREKKIFATYKCRLPEKDC